MSRPLMAGRIRLRMPAGRTEAGSGSMPTASTKKAGRARWPGRRVTFKSLRWIALRNGSNNEAVVVEHVALRVIAEAEPVDRHGGMRPLVERHVVANVVARDRALLDLVTDALAVAQRHRRDAIGLADVVGVAHHHCVASGHLGLAAIIVERAAAHAGIEDRGAGVQTVGHAGLLGLRQ